MYTNELPLDANGIPFSKPAFWLNSIEYSKIYSEINQIYDVQSFGIDGVAYIYWFENHGFDNYNIFLRIVDNH